jgi:hypothetical protein
LHQLSEFEKLQRKVVFMDAYYHFTKKRGAGLMNLSKNLTAPPFNPPIPGSPASPSGPYNDKTGLV